MIDLAHFLLELEMFQTKVVEKIKTHILFSCRLWDNVQKYRASIKYFLDYRHLLQENYVEYKHMQL
jgi:hypothetical protein